jgi:hypothetical protein
MEAGPAELEAASRRVIQANIRAPQALGCYYPQRDSRR